MSRSEYTAFQCLASVARKVASEQEDWRQVLAKRDATARHWHQRQASKVRPSLFARILKFFRSF